MSDPSKEAIAIAARHRQPIATAREIDALTEQRVAAARKLGRQEAWDARHAGSWELAQKFMPELSAADRPAPEGAAPTGEIPGCEDWEAQFVAESRCSTPSQEDTGSVSGTKLWLWKNGDHYRAFAHEYPTYGGGDPMVLGEPAGYAVLVPSEPRRSAPPTDAGGPGSASNTESSPTQRVAPPGPTAGDVERSLPWETLEADELREISDVERGERGADFVCVTRLAISDALSAERASARAELLAQIREDPEVRGVVAQALADSDGPHGWTWDENAGIALRALADKLTEAK